MTTELKSFELFDKYPEVFLERAISKEMSRMFSAEQRKKKERKKVRTIKVYAEIGRADNP